LVCFTTQQQEFASAVEQFCEKTLRDGHNSAMRLSDGGRLSNSPEILRKFRKSWLARGGRYPSNTAVGGAGMAEECIFLEETARGLAPIHAYGTGLNRRADLPAPWRRAAEEGSTRATCAVGTSRRSPFSEPGAGIGLERA